ncbi:PucR family transcriptional regulator [uncultured Serinicoccus sp.]|uniref:PucR family transcriptional regulator n=1 Tax=uncultured Serinicoccus sp. TaxID=735514 RepID=UPI002621B9DB|nr:PucR family transcriptional regulator [uncultured Serinicoccus sp.]
MREATLLSLLGERRLALRLVVGPGDVDGDDLDGVVEGVHSSDLADPAPFLDEGMVLLTTGSQLDLDRRRRGGTEGSCSVYVRRLRDKGVRGLGFGTGVVHQEIPEALVTACREHRMPLFDVPYDTPFIAVARANADALASRAYARRAWALAAHRALASAALRPDGLDATVAELAAQLGAWVGLFGAAGGLVARHPRPPHKEIEERLRGEAEGLLRRGERVATRWDLPDGAYSVQTIGRGGRLRGVLAVGVVDLDPEARGVVAASASMVGLALEQQETVHRERRAVNRGLAPALVAGEVDLVSGVLKAMGRALPREPVLVGVADAALGESRLGDWLAVRAVDDAVSLFAGVVGDELLLVVPAEGAEVLDEVSRRFEVRVGVSTPTRYAWLTTGIDQARVARARGIGGLSHFADVPRERLLLSLAGGDTAAAAATIVAPVRTHDAQHGTSLEETLRVWFANGCVSESTATALSVHRHTVRSRLALAQRLLGLDLESFPVRAEVWAALEVASGEQAAARGWPAAGQSLL